MRVLIADDDLMFRTLLDRSLRGWGYETVTAEDGQKAWDLLRSPGAPRIAILDWQMPGLDGIEICKRVRTTSELPFIYTIMLTGREAREDMTTGLEAGADDYLVKPVDASVLRSRLGVARRIVEAVPPREWAMPRVPGYDVQRLLGRGAVGSVWHAVQTTTGRAVALKVMRPELVTGDVLGRFRREIQISERLDHPNIARVYESHIDESLCYYAMELVDGSDLGAWAARVKPGLRDTLELMAKVCAGVAHAHEQGVVHRDLKPQNLLVTRDNQPKVVDFGVAKTVLPPNARADDYGDSVQTLQNTALGTPLFMSPEQARGHHDRVDARSDVYALGVIIYLLLVRHHPHNLQKGGQWEVMRSIADGVVRLPSVFWPEIDPMLEKIVMKALAQEPEGRYPHAGHLGADLTRFVERRMAG